VSLGLSLFPVSEGASLIVPAISTFDMTETSREELVGSELGLFARVDGVLFISLSSFNRLDVSSARGGVLYTVFRVFVVYSF
jgi:hypothetical protein